MLCIKGLCVKPWRQGCRYVASDRVCIAACGSWVAEALFWKGEPPVIINLGLLLCVYSRYGGSASRFRVTRVCLSMRRSKHEGRRLFKSVGTCSIGMLRYRLHCLSDAFTVDVNMDRMGGENG